MTTTAPPTTALAPYQAPGTIAGLERLGASQLGRLGSMLSEETAKRCLRVLVIEAQRTPKLLACTSESILQALYQCAGLGLEPGGPLGHVYLIPYGDKCTTIVGYKGLLELVRRSGQISRCNAGVVYRDEIKRGRFHATIEPPSLRHDLDLEIDRSDSEIVAAYAVAHTDQGPYQVVLSRPEIEARRRRGAARGSGPWGTDYASMARKSALRALLAGGMVPLSPQIAAVLEAEVDAEIETRNEARGVAVQEAYVASGVIAATAVEPEPPAELPPQKVATPAPPAPAPEPAPPAPPPAPAEPAPAPREHVIQYEAQIAKAAGVTDRFALLDTYRQWKRLDISTLEERKRLSSKFTAAAKACGWPDGKSFAAEAMGPQEEPAPATAPPPEPRAVALAAPAALQRAQGAEAPPADPGAKLAAQECLAITQAAASGKEGLAALFGQKMQTWTTLEPGVRTKIVGHLNGTLGALGLTLADLAKLAAVSS